MLDVVSDPNALMMSCLPQLGEQEVESLRVAAMPLRDA